MQLALRGLGASAVDTAFSDLTANQKFVDDCCYGYFYGGYFTPGCAEYIAANKSKFGNFEPCAYARYLKMTPAQIVANETNAGASLTPEARAEATRQAQAAIAADIAKHPELYSELCPAGQIPQADGNCAACPAGFVASGGVCVEGSKWGGFEIPQSVLLIGGLIGAAILLLALKR